MKAASIFNSLFEEISDAMLEECRLAPASVCRVIVVDGQDDPGSHDYTQ
jgi:hypothetical protein